MAATDPDGGIASVDFFANGERIGRTANLLIDPAKGVTSIHEFVWESPPVGLHEIHVRALDESGSSVRSFPLWVYAGIPRPEPRIAISLPDGVTYNRNESILMVIEAVSPVSPVDFVDVLGCV